MNNQEYKAKLESYLERAEAIVRGLKKDIDEADRMFAEAEKPKLKVGDFGIADMAIFPRIVIAEGEAITASGHVTDRKADMPSIVYFNVFDLIADWDKDFKNVVMKNSYNDRVFLIQKSLLAEKDIYLGTEDLGHKMGVYLTISEAKEICHTLGHAIVDKLRQTK